MSWQILYAARTGLVHTTPVMPLGLTRPLSISQHFLFFLFLPEPLYTAIASFNLSNTLTNATKASCMPHLDAGLAPTPLDHPHLRHNPRASSSLIDVHSRPSHCPLGGCYRYLSSLNVRRSYIEICDYSSTTMTIPVPTKEDHERD